MKWKIDKILILKVNVINPLFIYKYFFIFFIHLSINHKFLCVIIFDLLNFKKKIQIK